MNFNNFLKKINLNDKGYTLIELIITIFIVGIILTTASLLLVSLVKTSNRVDVRRNIRQDLELSLEVMKRDIRNADPSLSFTECEPSVRYDLFSTDDTGDIGLSALVEGPPRLGIVLTSGSSTVNYTVVENDIEDTFSLRREYTKSGGKPVVTYLTSDDVDLKGFVVNCNKLAKENKFLLISVIADSVESDNDGKIVENLTRITGTTIRNVNSN